jgi:hypothetical protein
MPGCPNHVGSDGKTQQQFDRQAQVRLAANLAPEYKNCNQGN